MTSNQINFAKLKEDSRANRAQEGLKSQSISEEQRHNLAMERTNWYGAETARSVGMTQAGASVMQAQAAKSQADTQAQKQTFEESKYSDTGRNWISAQTDKLYAESDLTRNKNAEYTFYDPHTRGWIQQTKDWSDVMWGPVKAVLGAAK